MGHSVGGLIVRAALAYEELKPYHPLLWAFLSIAVPHLGFMYSSNAIVNGAVRCLAVFKASMSMKQLTFADAPRLEDCFLYKLAAAPAGLNLFHHVVLITCKADQYVPHHSAKLTTCRAAESGTGRHSAAYCAMLGNILHSVNQSRRTQLARVEVDFAADVARWSFGRLIGHTAHVAFLETERYTKTLAWALLHKHGIVEAHAGAYL